MPVPLHHDAAAWRQDLARGRSLNLRLEPGARPVTLWRLALWDETGHLQAGGFTFAEADASELFGALAVMRDRIHAEGLPQS